ncbi:MAG: hypothetical protein MZV70_11245 [Desulfobacterales bacterium]|nr:hypothetical protein [Desulfobacterales bacterium]
MRSSGARAKANGQRRLNIQYRVIYAVEEAAVTVPFRVLEITPHEY